MCVHSCMYVCACVPVSVCACAFMCMYVYAYIYACVHVFVCVCVHLCGSVKLFTDVSSFPQAFSLFDCFLRQCLMLDPMLSWNPRHSSSSSPLRPADRRFVFITAVCQCQALFSFRSVFVPMWFLCFACVPRADLVSTEVGRECQIP